MPVRHDFFDDFHHFFMALFFMSLRNHTDFFYIRIQLVPLEEEGRSVPEEDQEPREQRVARVSESSPPGEDGLPQTAHDPNRNIGSPPPQRERTRSHALTRCPKDTPSLDPQPHESQRVVASHQHQEAAPPSPDDYAARLPQHHI